MSAIYSDRSKSRQTFLTTLCLVNEAFRAEAVRQLFDVVVLRSDKEATAFLDAMARLRVKPRTRVLVLSGPQWTSIAGAVASRVVEVVRGVESLTLGNVAGLDARVMYSPHLSSLKLLRIEETTTIGAQELVDSTYHQLGFSLDAFVFFTTFDAASTCVQLLADILTRVKGTLFVRSRTFGSDLMSNPKLPISPIDLRPFRHLFASTVMTCQLDHLVEAYLMIDDEAQYALLEPVLQRVAQSDKLERLVTSLPSPALFKALDSHQALRTTPSRHDRRRRDQQPQKTLIVRATSPEDYMFLKNSLTKPTTMDDRFMDTVTHLEIVRPKPVDELELVQAVKSAQDMDMQVTVY
ncbi:hypothetical protein ACM66B_002548 [Microbotryomycetes sp. NB124-2]